MRFFGAPRIERVGQPIRPDTRKAIALLAYLVVTGQPHTRDALTALLYPEYDESHAKAALRRTLSALTTSLGQGTIQVNHERISLTSNQPIWVDVIEFQDLVGKSKNYSRNSTGEAPADYLEICQHCRQLLEKAIALHR
jgi:DNA-binding SARP family transcriptional activator